MQFGYEKIFVFSPECIFLATKQKLIFYVTKFTRFKRIFSRGVLFFKFCLEVFFLLLYMFLTYATPSLIFARGNVNALMQRIR